MNLAKRFTPKTTYQKMIRGFLLLGVLPLLTLGLLYFVRYRVTAENVMMQNYGQINRYYAMNVMDVIKAVDEAEARLYEYADRDQLTVTDVLTMADVDDSETTLLIQNALEYSMEGCPYIASERFCDKNGRIYSAYRDQEKVMRADAKAYTTLRNQISDGTDIRNLVVLKTLPEESICIRSDDYIFSVTRNFMDISRIEQTGRKVLGTVYADINVSVFDNLTEEMNVEAGELYIYNPSDGDYLYAADKSVYRKEADPLEDYRTDISGASGVVKKNGEMLFYQQLGELNQYSILLLDRREMTGVYYQGRTFLILILCFVAFAALMLYMWFSNRLMEPAKEIKEAMEAVQRGNLDVRVDVHTSDEMEYIADGFNRMTASMKEHIEKVYVAEIMQRDAQLNALRMQIRPHYLYNTLDVIRMTALENKDSETARMLESLAFQLRYVMGDYTDRVALDDELKMLEEYFVIMRTRYENRISLHIEVSNADRRLLIPKLILQPIVENAVRHGLKPKKDGGHVEIRSQRKDGELLIVVMDNGVGVEPERLAQIMELLQDHDISAGVANGEVSVGMKNVYDRIRINCGDGYGYSIESVPGFGTVVTYHLPIWESEDDKNVDTAESV